MISLDKTGGRTVHLFIPFDQNGKKIESISFAPLRLGHVLRWNEGAWKSSLDLMVELSGVDESILRDVRYPDAERVTDAFMAILTPEIRDDITNGRIPMKREEPIEDIVEAAARASNGGGEPIPPGAPLPPEFTTPESGFDMSEEP
jgi:hypothetical protein